MSGNNDLSAVMPLIAPDLAARQAKNQMAQMLAQNMMSQPQAQGHMAGQVYVGPSWAEGLANGVNKVLGAKMMSDAMRDNIDINSQFGQRLGMGGGAAQPVDNSGAPVDNSGNTQYPQQGTDAFGANNLIKGRVIGMLGGDQAASAYWKRYEPTDLQRNDSYLGISPQDSRATELAKRNKEGALSVGDNGYTVLPNGQIMWGSDIKGGTVTLSGPNGMPVSVSIPGSNENAAARAGIIKRAEMGVQDQFATPAPVNLPGGPVAMTPAQQRAAANGGVDPAMPAPLANNNPGAMMPGGKLANYPSFEAGLAAMDKNLQSYGNGGVNTVAGVISKWAPPKDANGKPINNTDAYIKDVSSRLGINPNQPIDLSKPQVRMALSTAIMLHENGINGVFGRGQPAQQQGIRLETPGDQAVNAEKGKAAINAASISTAAEPLLNVINQARQINNNVPYGPWGMAEARAKLSQIPGMDHTAATNAALWDQMVGQSILNTISSLASSGGIRMDIPIVKEIQKAGGIPMSLPPEARARMLDQLESEIRSRISAANNVVPALNRPGITTKTQTSPMAGNSAPMSLDDYLKSKGH